MWVFWKNIGEPHQLVELPLKLGMFECTFKPRCWKYVKKLYTNVCQLASRHSTNSHVTTWTHYNFAFATTTNIISDKSYLVGSIKHHGVAFLGLDVYELPLPLCLGSTCPSVVWPVAFPPQVNCQELQWECSRWEGGWHASTIQSTFLPDTLPLCSCHFEYTSVYQWEFVTVFPENTICVRCDVADLAGTSSLLGLQKWRYMTVQNRMIENIYLHKYAISTQWLRCVHGLSAISLGP